MTTDPGAGGAAGGSGATADLLRALTDDLTTLVRSELRRAQDELADKARQAARGGALLGGAGVLGALSLATSTVLVVRILDRFLPPRAAAFVATALYGGGAAALAVAGWNELRRSLPPSPGDALSGVREDVRAVREGATGEPSGS
jgi:hypothetical protein